MRVEYEPATPTKDAVLKECRKRKQDGRYVKTIWLNTQEWDNFIRETDNYTGLDVVRIPRPDGKFVSVRCNRHA